MIYACLIIYAIFNGAVNNAECVALKVEWLANWTGSRRKKQSPNLRYKVLTSDQVLWKTTKNLVQYWVCGRRFELMTAQTQSRSAVCLTLTCSFTSKGWMGEHCPMKCSSFPTESQNTVQQWYLNRKVLWLWQKCGISKAICWSLMYYKTYYSLPEFLNTSKKMKS